MASISKISLTLPATTDPPDITVINTALKQLETSLNAAIEEINNAVKYSSVVDTYLEVEIEE